MIVEFVGIPGAGKSTLLLSARDIFSVSNLKAMPVFEAGPYCLKRMFLGRMVCSITPHNWQNRVLLALFHRLVLLYRLKFALKNKSLSWEVINSVIRRRLSWAETRAILRWFFRDVSYYQFFQNRLQPNEVLILDEGLIQRATTLYALPFKAPDALKIKQYLTRLPQADLVIWVEAALDVCLDRVVARGTETRYTGQELQSFIANSAKTLEIATQAIEEEGWKIIRINNDDSLEQGIIDLRDILEKRDCQPSIAF